MKSTEEFYLENETAVGFLKPYKGGKYAFVGLLPKEGLSLKDYVGSLTGAELQSLLESASPESVEVSLPKFKLEYSAELSEVMQAMGMNLAFDAVKADFSGLGSSAGGNLAISRIPWMRRERRQPLPLL